MVALLLTSKVVVLKWGNFSYQGTFDYVWRRLWPSQCVGSRGSATGASSRRTLVNSQKHRTAPTTKNDLAFHILSAEVEKPCLLAGENVEGWVMRFMAQGERTLLPVTHEAR